MNIYRGGGIDLKTGVTRPVYEGLMDMRVFVEKYRFFDGEFILGSKAGVEMSTPDRLLAVSYEYGQDGRDTSYHAFGCSLTVPFRLENLFLGRNPFEQPETPGYRTRYADRLMSGGVKRTWRSPATVVEARKTPQGERWTTPGRLKDSIWNVSKSDKKADEKTVSAGTDNSRCCRKCCECGSSQYGKSDISPPPLGSGLCALAAYLTGDYLYRNAFGPFELDPYEVENINREMSKPRSKQTSHR